MNLAIIGHPIGHTLSPAMQKAALAEKFPTAEYIPIDIPPGKLVVAVEGLKNLGFRGFNVTIPHKTNVMQFLDEVDPDAKIIGAVNTVVNNGGRLTGYNTDVIGFLAGLENFNVTDSNAVMLGAGGAARAVLWALCKRKAKRISIGVRNALKAQKLADDFKDLGTIEVFHWEDQNFDDRLSEADILINTTPLGMSPHIDNMPPIDLRKLNQTAFVYDLIYTPEKTKFLLEAEKLGHKIANGVEMLVFQGAESFRLWTGEYAEVEVMRRAMIDRLSQL